LLAIQHKTCLLQNLNLNERGWKCESSLLGNITPFLKDLLLKQDEYSKIYDRKLRITNNKFDQTTDKLTIIGETLSENNRNATVAISNSDKKIQIINDRIAEIEHQLSSTIPTASQKFDETRDILTTKIENVTKASSNYEKQIQTLNEKITKIENQLSSMIPAASHEVSSRENCYFNYHLVRNFVYSGWTRNIQSQTVIFSKDDGSKNCGYDPSTGIFTAQTDGFFHFSFNVLRKGKDKDLSVDLMLGTESVCNVYSRKDSRNYGDTMSCSYTTELKAGQTVFCRLKSGTIPSGNWSQFHGFRIN